MIAPDSAASRPTPSQAQLLGLLLDQMLERRGGVPYYKFRSAHFQRVPELELMETEGWLKRDNDLYLVQTTIFPLIDTEAARRLMADIERIYAALREQYLLTQQAPVKIASLAAATQLSSDAILDSLRLMLDTTLWQMGSSLTLPIEEASISPAESILQFGSYADLAARVRSWRPATNFFPGALAASETGKPSSTTETAPPRLLMPVIRAWPPARSCLQAFKFDEIKEIAGLAGFDVTAAAHLVQGEPVNSTKGQLLAVIDAQLRGMDTWETSRFLTALMEEMLRRSPAAEEKLAEYLNRLGWTFIDGKLLPVALFDGDALDDMPADAQPDLLKAAQRLRDGDLCGAISAAAGAVDAAVARVYEQEQLGDPTRASFQEGCKHALGARGVLVDLEGKLTGLGWEVKDAFQFTKNLESALIKGAFVMQTLRSHMGDVHGSKPILRALVFDSLRWAELLVGALVVKPSHESS